MNVTARDILNVYWAHMRRYPKVMTAMIIAVIGANILEAVIPLVYKRFFDVLAGGAVSDFLTIQALWNAVVLVMILNLASWCLWRVCTFGNNYFEPHVMTDLMQSSFDYLQHHSYRFFTNSFVGSLVKKVTRLSRSFETFVDRTYWNFFPLIIRTLGVIIVLAWFNRVIAALLVTWIIIYLSFNFFFARWKLPYDRIRNEKDSESTGVLADGITNTVNIHLFNGFSREQKRFNTVTEEVRRIRTFTWNLEQVVEAVQALLMITVEFALMALAIRYWRSGTLTVGTFVLIQTYLIYLFARLWDVGRYIRDLYESFSDAREMVEILLTPHEVRDIATAKPFKIRDGRVEFKDVSFAYHQTRKVLDHVSFVIQPGEKVALVGPSGSGKSTIVKLLFRFYDIDEGKILIDGQKVHTVTQESLHQVLSMVPQDPVLFHRSLMENIRYGKPEASDKEVYQAAHLAHCDEFIQEFPQKYETKVGERGVKLSGGERQRVAIARAILRNAPILVLDEATSSLDSHSEMLIQDALKILMKMKTTIVIAHRLSTVQQMDRIIVLSRGKIAEEGSHAKLLKTRTSLYKHLWELQAGGFFVPDDEKEE